MPDSDRISIDNLTLAPDLSNNDVAPVVHTVNGVKSTYKATMTLLGTFLNKVLQYSADLTTSDKTIIGAINEINAGGGGGGAVILYGTSAPASSLGSDGNLYVQYTAGTGGASDVVDALYVKLDGEWCEISTKQVQSDWSQSDNTKVDYIKNKPTIPAAQIQSNWAQSDNTKVDYIKNKPTIYSSADVLPITSGSATNTKSYVDTNITSDRTRLGKIEDTTISATKGSTMSASFPATPSALTRCGAFVTVQFGQQLPAGTYTANDTLWTITPAPRNIARAIVQTGAYYNVINILGTGEIRFNGTITFENPSWLIGQISYITALS